MTDGIKEIQEWNEVQLIADINFVRRHIFLALSMPQQESDKYIRLIYSKADQILEILQALVKTSLGKLGKSDIRRLLLLDQLATFGGYQSIILLLMGLHKPAAEKLHEIRISIEEESSRMLADWTEGVDLREAVPDKNELGKFLLVLETIDSKPPSDRLLESYWSMPFPPACTHIVRCRRVYLTGDYKSSADIQALVDRTLPTLDNNMKYLTFIRRGQIVGSYVEPNGSRVVLIPEEDGYFIGFDEEYSRDVKILSVKALKRPIEDLTGYVERLANIVSNVRNMCDRADFACEHPELAHELAGLCLKRPDAQDGIILKIDGAVPENTVE
ncbi:hypothetical protein [Gluconobacter japonicus]|uniref:hypothetical protein n=1 Tax=Gluconobacter japonicus TaxID=376620 RepID=UPI001B8C4116|nr:hypothetical protein [Gluconobacter japonicus]MBS1051910.1 hypothetical protein [Gluconobacter japonicus]